MFPELAGFHGECKAEAHPEESDALSMGWDPSKAGATRPGGVGGNLNLMASGDARSRRTGKWSRHWQTVLWAFAIAGWGVIWYLHHSFPSFP